MKKLFFTIVSVVLINAFTEAQVVVDTEYDEALFKARVSLVEDFMRRFNEGTILPLFDGTMFGHQGENDSLYKEAQKFAAAARKSGVKLSNTDTNWVALAPCSGKFKGKPVDFMLILNTEKYAPDAYKWVIAGVQGDIFKLTPSSYNIDFLISPLAHEVNFMELGRITMQKDDLILNYKQKRYELDETAVFFAYVYEGLLDIEHVKGLQFMFLQVPGWSFTIEEFNRQTMNSGWLITSFSKMSDTEKKAFLQNVYHKK